MYKYTFASYPEVPCLPYTPSFLNGGSVLDYYWFIPCISLRLGKLTTSCTAAAVLVVRCHCPSLSLSLVVVVLVACHCLVVVLVIIFLVVGFCPLVPIVVVVTVYPLVAGVSVVPSHCFCCCGSASI